MIPKLLAAVFGSRNQRLLKIYQKTVVQIAKLEDGLKPLTDEQLQAITPALKARVQGGESLDSVLPEAFALVREASRRVMGMRHFDAQMLGGMALHYGKIAEMRTGEGKTLTATLAVYLNALSGKGVHVVTVNDYLAQRDAEWMGQLYNWLGMTVGVNLSGLERAQKQAAYASDITYGTNNEFGFDYLRDNLVLDRGDRVQRPLNFGIVDEVDSILIDEARTPLIISGAADDHTEMYIRINAVPPLLTRMAAEPKPNEPEPDGDFWLDEKGRQVHLSEAGHEKAENILRGMGLLPAGASLYSAANISLMHHVMSGLRAHNLYHRDQHYVVQEGEVVIVDEFTGRLMTGRRWSDGLHQAVEAKEGVAIQTESQTLASITFQNYFRMYTKLGGMTGTADTEAYEFQQIYNLETVVIPTHRNMVRKDMTDLIYRTETEKYRALVKDIADCYERGQPVLVGTTSVEQSEMVSAMLKTAQLPHEVLNAKQHEREAQIVAQAGKPKAITVATNMAGRGTDIVLGGNVEKQIQFVNADAALSDSQKTDKAQALRDEWQSLQAQVMAAGGLKIVGSERHESRRIDNQLRGRAGRQGDPGSSRFYLSMDDQLLRIFGGERLQRLMTRLNMPEDEALDQPMLTRTIESSQRKVEGHNFDMRKQLLEYDDVANEQRKIIYAQRNEILETEQTAPVVTRLRHGVLELVFHEHVPAESVEEQWDLDALQTALNADWGLDINIQALAAEKDNDDKDMLAAVITAADAHYQAKVDLVGAEGFANFERTLMLQVMDSQWREHLAALDYLRQGIHLRGFAQKNPKQEYKRESFEMFGALLDNIRAEVTRVIMTIRIRDAEEVAQAEAALEQAATPDQMAFQHSGVATESSDAMRDEPAEPKSQPLQRFGDKIGRNDPCPCGSGKKFKQCHGVLS